MLTLTFPHLRDLCNMMRCTLHGDANEDASNNEGTTPVFFPLPPRASPAAAPNLLGSWILFTRREESRVAVTILLLLLMMKMMTMMTTMMMMMMMMITMMLLRALMCRRMA